MILLPAMATFGQSLPATETEVVNRPLAANPVHFYLGVSAALPIDMESIPVPADAPVDIGLGIETQVAVSLSRLSSLGPELSYRRFDITSREFHDGRAGILFLGLTARQALPMPMPAERAESRGERLTVYTAILGVGAAWIKSDEYVSEGNLIYSGASAEGLFSVKAGLGVERRFSPWFTLAVSLSWQYVNDAGLHFLPLTFSARL
jgi:hypothetical protein